MAEQLALGFGGLLRQLRAEAGLTQEELAEAASLSPRSVSDLERGINRTARKDTAELLAGALGLAEPARALFVAAARGRAPAEEVLAALREATAPRRSGVPGGPYLGLVPFEERDARLFYGRDELAERLVRRLAERLDGAGILLVAGESGSGKSSLLRAGLLPRLAAGALGPGSQRWPRRVIRPRPARCGSWRCTWPRWRARIRCRYTGRWRRRRMRRRCWPSRRRGPPGAARIRDRTGQLMPRPVRHHGWSWWSTSSRSCSPRARTDGAVERRAFVTALHAAATIPAGPRGVPPALVVAAVRADYLGRLIAFPPLKAALDAGLFTVGPMSEAELRLAVTGPAAEAGLVVEPAVVETLIAELRDEAGSGLGSGVLPLMSQAMAATWERREGNELTLRGYRRAGGVADAVNRGAQAPTTP